LADITEERVLEILLKVLKDTDVGVNLDNMDLYDESPDYVIGYYEVIKNIEDKLKKEKGD